MAKKGGSPAQRAAGSPRVTGSRGARGDGRRAEPRDQRTILPWLASLSMDRKLDLLGILLLVLGLFSVVSLFFPQEGSMTRAWLDVLRHAFGWGLLAVPAGLLAGGLWLLLRAFHDRLPRVRGEQVIGAALLYLALLVLLHVAVGAGDLDSGMALARQGLGGGAVGAALLALSLGGLGVAGTLVVLAAWVLLGVTLVVGLSVSELLGLVGSRMRRLRVGRQPESEALAPHPGGRAVAAMGPSSSAATAPTLASIAAVPETVEAPQVAWTLPVVAEVLEPGAEGKADVEFDRQRAKLIEDTLLAFGAPAHVVEINRGPTITQFGVEPDFVDGRAGRRTKVKVSKISALADDLALALAAPSIRVEAPVPGKGFVGIEVPNPEIALVALRDVMEAETFRKVASALRLGLGRDVSGRPIAADLSAMPHLLIAGTTGSGKSVCVNAIVACLLLQNTPDDLRLVMVDPKRVELTFYNGIPHLLAPVVVDLERVVPALQWVSREMDERYRRFAREGVRNIAEYNRRMAETGEKGLFYLVVVIDELADLMMLAPDETERVVTRLAQLARATGIHLVIATQRPSVDVVTGLIKANFPARIAFAVASSVDSRVILDQPGAERLLGRGDMLFQSPDAAAPVRMQGAFVSEAELARLIAFWRDARLSREPQPAPAAPQPIPAGAPLKQAAMWEDLAPAEEDTDQLFDEAVEIVRQMRRASISLLQRRLRIGYTRSARLVDQLEEHGIIGPAKEGSQAREVLDYGELAAPEEG